MEVGLEVKGAKALEKKMKFLNVSTTNNVTLKAIINGTALVEGTAMKNISSGSNADEWSALAHAQTGKQKLSGRKLRIGKGDIGGALRASITHQFFFKKGVVEGAVGTNSDYGRIHELGGYAGRGRRVLIPARPYLFPALLENIEKIKKMFKEKFWIQAKKARGIK